MAAGILAVVFALILVAAPAPEQAGKVDRCDDEVKAAQVVVTRRLDQLKRHRVATPSPSGALSTLYFLHVPKTAGTSMLHAFLDAVATSQDNAADRSILRCHRHLDLSNCFIVYNATSATQCTGGRPAACGYVLTHAGLDVTFAMRRDVLAVTILRDPASRLLSYYNYLRRPANPSAFARWYRASPQRALDNIMTGYLAGEAMGPAGALVAPVWHPITNASLGSAKRHLISAIDLWGFQEDLNPFLRWLAYLWPHHNASKHIHAMTTSKRYQPHEHGTRGIESSAMPAHSTPTNLQIKHLDEVLLSEVCDHMLFGLIGQGGEQPG
ncbi:uncharacterized protein MONBRDRAFT_4844 [Monosiga brevicollis MX1]|uniref:Sulfotransferase domain-containing protein n=1 Tax=Monosiga brevicollis TaxID=81824 RepID=A9UP43_MONBE|nr:uncharacterized protein MONBRDRAFT_4844 [Monosiga brevicollis MX1]EDQ92356.1 predicted protein [Monosiga brevicollis MX1]|eukprot:XP_001742118.1 hypothetical protein [Monosiga brevicollis MX1]